MAILGKCRWMLACALLAMAGGVLVWSLTLSNAKDHFLASVGSEAETLLAITNSYVNTYQSVRSAAAQVELPVPAKFRADAISHFNNNLSSTARVTATMFGLPGRGIASPPSGPSMATHIQEMLYSDERQVKTHLVSLDNDSIARIGGEEFVIWLDGCNFEFATSIAERIRLITESTVLKLDAGEVRFTVSVGVLTTEKQDGFDFDRWLKAADSLLYGAKSAGRNSLFGAIGLSAAENKQDIFKSGSAANSA